MHAFCPYLPQPLQIAEALDCLRHVLAHRLPMAAALRTLPALDSLLQQLATATGRQLHEQLPQCQGGSGGAAQRGAGAGVPVPTIASRHTSLLPFVAAALSASATVRWGGEFKRLVWGLLGGLAPCGKRRCICQTAPIPAPALRWMQLRLLFLEAARAVCPGDAAAISAAEAELHAGRASVAGVAAVQGAALAALGGASS